MSDHLTFNQLNNLLGNGRVALAEDIYGLTDEELWENSDDEYDLSGDPQSGRPRTPRFLEVGE